MLLGFDKYVVINTKMHYLAIVCALLKRFYKFATVFITVNHNYILLLLLIIIIFVVNNVHYHSG